MAYNFIVGGPDVVADKMLLAVDTCGVEPEKLGEVIDVCMELSNVLAGGGKFALIQNGSLMVFAKVIIPTEN